MQDPLNQNNKGHKDLEQAFSTFNSLSVQLTESYRELEKRVSDLNHELHDTQSDYIKELKAKERIANRLESLLSVLPGGVVVLDGHGLIQDYNRAAIDLLGDPLAKKPWYEVIQRAFSPRYDDGHEVSLVDGRRVKISTCPLESEPGQILLLTEVTEMRTLQDRLNQHQRLAAMGEMAASLAHQVRTPLASALLHASSLKREKLSNTERKTLSEKIVTKLGQLDLLVNDMLLYSRNGTVTEEDFSIPLLCEDIQLYAKPLLSSSRTKFKLLNKITDSYLFGNRKMLVSALNNLITNAIQAMGDNGEIIVETEKRLGKLLISIRDNGPGMSNKVQHQIFKPFFTTKSDGTGLGLAVVTAIANAHGGIVRVDSEPGKGSVFTMELPIKGEHSRTLEKGNVSKEYRSTEKRFISVG
ncbi:Flagellar sensor histidine kinase FleS [hydrothermal vent metagenome]|uniref:Flagellar sensor histidine kinase FleS n=1 Tax=hydrothermal vent metagenome TaxID=652676 RepID=A0A3B0ZXX1_9ZZZZ